MNMPVSTIQSDTADKTSLYGALRRHVTGWYQRAYGDASPHARMIEFYASETERRTSILFGPWEQELHASPPAAVLDVGCGFASIPVYLAWHWRQSRVLATDRTDYYYACGAGAAEELGLDNIRFETRDIGAIDQQGEFDLVMSCNMLNFMTSPEQLQDALGRLATACRSGGRVVVYTPHFWSFFEPFTRLPLLHFLPPAWQDRIVRKLGKRSGMLDVRNPSLGEIRRALEPHGVVLESVYPPLAVQRVAGTHMTAWFRKR
ncbi:class I SAM-dependent methyltransferase [Caenimonas sedimenti]|uniref:Class I SAM-dependent methyltransferase n=1 Tax=Caenimonas sedimenti TaxID=2596921 RepID=A0A562ZUT3_9BURK|nr:class I SAM-dependent methyltransferase [Caenimonas sedimenti]TWO72098.1 class I SAM-dependent methyltransferase [Caenimonas sedimenti]